jgi:hypothetical protein
MRRLGQRRRSRVWVKRIWDSLRQRLKPRCKCKCECKCERASAGFSVQRKCQAARPAAHRRAAAGAAMGKAYYVQYSTDGSSPTSGTGWQRRWKRWYSWTRLRGRKRETERERGRERAIRSNCEGGGGRLKYKTTKVLYSTAVDTAVLLSCCPVLYSPYFRTLQQRQQHLPTRRAGTRTPNVGSSRMAGLAGGITTSLYFRVEQREDSS